MLSTTEGASMTSTTEPTLTHVASPDGTKIAVFVSGRGRRPLVVAPGTTSDHTTWRFVLPFLEPHVAVHAVDRRGRGHSRHQKEDGDEDPGDSQGELLELLG